MKLKKEYCRIAESEWIAFQEELKRDCNAVRQATKKTKTSLSSAIGMTRVTRVCVVIPLMTIISVEDDYGATTSMADVGIS
jgi:hypothetical protein